MPTTLLSTAYFGPIQYYLQLHQSTDPVIESCEHYVKQTYRNRCIIATANGLMPLSLPIEKSSTGKTDIRDVKLSNHSNWQHLHWNSIESAYNSSPYFEFYADDLRSFFEYKPNYLFDLNESIRVKIYDLLDISDNVRYTTDYLREEEIPEEWQDLRYTFHPKKEKQDPGFAIKPYYQVFKQKFGFLPNLSILDLLFNMGPESIFYL
jgi:hypothetical protein